MKKSIITKLRNSFHPNYGECARCGGNWGWKKYVCHPTSDSTRLFLFCAECDTKVTVKERWDALDDWKRTCTYQLYQASYRANDLEKHLDIIRKTEFIEYPRNVKS